MSDIDDNTSISSAETMLPSTLASPFNITVQDTINFGLNSPSPTISPFSLQNFTPQQGLLSTVHQLHNNYNTVTYSQEPTYTRTSSTASNYNITRSFTPQSNRRPETMNTWSANQYDNQNRYDTGTTTASTFIPNQIPPTSTQSSLRCQHPNCIGIGRSRITCRQCQSSFHHTCVGLPDNLPSLPNLNFNCNLCLQLQNIQQQLVTQNQILQNMTMNSPTLKYKPLPINIPRFYGKYEEDPNEFLEKCESNLIAAACPPEQWLYAVTPQLKDRAKDWWIAQKITCKTWEDFITRFTKYFNGPSQLVRAQAQFYGETQQEHEQCERFVGRKLQMWRRLNPQIDDRHAIPSIIQMMKPAIRPYLITTPPRTIEQLLSISSEIERDCTQLQPHIKDHHSSHNGPKRNSDYNKKQHPKSEPISHIAPKCHFCPDYHFHRDCPVKRNQNNSQHTTNRDEQKPFYKKEDYHNKQDFYKKDHFQHKRDFQTKEEPHSSRQQEDKPHSSKAQTNIINTFSDKQTNNITNSCDSIMDLICIPSYINNQKLNSIIDCGASANFIRSNLVNFKPLEPVAQTADLAEKDVSTKIIGKTNLEIELAGSKYNLTFYVCPNLNHDVLLGQPFLHRFKVIINYSKCSVTIGNRKRRVIYWKVPIDKSVSKKDNLSKSNPKTKQFPDKNKPEFGLAHCCAPRSLQKPDKQNSPPFKINTIINNQHSQFSSRKSSTGRTLPNQGKRNLPFSPKQSQSYSNQSEHFGKYQRNKMSNSHRLPMNPSILPPGTKVLLKDRSLSKGLYTIVSNIGQVYTIRCNYSNCKMKAHRSEINTISH
ncbi:hypothetical protein M8J77_000459 [Diaphorina citri]|nr:hypothetical protein M8J77_000459 [Diaphorina citri]